jgi:hypothetical protein
VDGVPPLRHTCASRLFAQGRNAVQVQRWLGHHSAAFTLSVYVHLLDGDLGGPLPAPAKVANEVATSPTASTRNASHAGLRNPPERLRIPHGPALIRNASAPS